MFRAEVCGPLDKGMIVL